MNSMAEADKTRQLNVKQENGIDLLLQGQNDREVAEAVGVSRQTVTEWPNGNAVFVAELNRRRQEVWEGEVERLRGLVAKAIDVLEEELEDEQGMVPLRVRQAAAVHILKAVGLYGTKLRPAGNTDPEALGASWRSERALTEVLKGL